jgi:hypothetical protein
MLLEWTGARSIRVVDSVGPEWGGSHGRACALQKSDGGYSTGAGERHGGNDFLLLTLESSSSWAGVGSMESQRTGPDACALSPLDSGERHFSAAA